MVLVTHLNSIMDKIFSLFRNPTLTTTESSCVGIIIIMIRNMGKGKKRRISERDREEERGKVRM